jgi:class 3 adenylate cyclase/tetratricopeptide (TPR) repeat protein
MVAETQPVAPWGSFLPYHIARELAADPAAELLGREWRLPAVALFADVSGFTALSEALARAPSGAGELTRILNAYFTPIIALIHSYGGVVGKFGGDSLSAFFPVEPGQRGPTARRAVACALALQAHVSRYANLETTAGTFTLGMRVGLADGSIYSTVVGDPAGRLEVVIAGAVLDRAAAAEADAAPGEVVVSGSLLPDLGYALTELRGGSRAPDARYAVRRTGDIPDPAPLPPLPPLPQAAVRRLVAFLPPTIARRLDEGTLELVGEHRAVTTLFVAFSGFDYDGDPEVGRRLQRYLARLFEVVRRYDGYVNKLDMGDKASKALILFGAPVAHDDDAARALQCALELRELGANLANGQAAARGFRVGVASGLAYSGRVGSSSRQEYTVIGAAVDLACRLMQAATSAEILGDASTAGAVNGAFDWGEERELPLGDGTAHARALLGSRAANPEAGSALLVGRAAELAALRERLALALERRGQVITVGGPTGVGKSALVAATLEIAARRGARRLAGECISYRSASPYLVWRPILRSLLGIAPDASPDEQAARAAAHLEALDPRLLPRLPLLNALAGLALPESEVTAALDGAARKAAAEDLACDLVAAAALETPTVIALESCHWIDPLSRDLLLALAYRCASLPVLLLLTYRSAPEAREEWAAPLRAAQIPHFAELPLGALDAEATANLVELVCHHTEQPVPPPAVVAQIAERTQGNPLFTVELLNTLRGRQLDAGADLELPDSLHRLVLNRIDRLDESTRTVLNVASVVGQEFRPAWLAGIYPALGATLERPLEELRRADMAILGGGPEPAYQFRQVITREVAYESLSTTVRADLHARVGGFIETTYADNLEPFLDLLAHHYSHSDNREKQREYLLRAGTGAQAAFANEAALGFYERLLPLLSPDERSDVLLRLGQVLRHMGRWEAAEARFREALDAAWDEVTDGRCRLELGDLLLRRGDYEAAAAWLEEARAAFAAAGDAGWLCEAERQLGLVALVQGDYPRAIEAFEHALQPLADSGDDQRLATLLINLGAVHFNMGDTSRAQDCFERSLHHATRSRNRQRIGVAVGNLGSVYHLRGDFGRALDCYGQKLQCALDIGDRAEISVSLGNLGHIYEEQGEFARAAACYLRSLELALDMGERMGVGTAIYGLATVALAEGALAQAEQLAGRAEAIFAAIAAEYELADCRMLRADIAARSGAYAAARTLLLEAEELAARSGNEAAAHSAEVLSIDVDRLRGALRPDAAVAHLEALLPNHESDEQRAALLYAIVRADGTQAAARAGAAGLFRLLHRSTPKAAYRRAYADMMGVALPPPPPLPAPPSIVTRRPAPREALLDRADALLGALQGDQLIERSA